MTDMTGNNETLLPYGWPGAAVIGAEEREAVLAVVDARSPFRFYGHDLQGYADQLENAYRERLGRRHALAVNSCTSALSIAMTALDIGPGDEVLVPGFMWVSCLAAVVRAGAVPVLVEIDAGFTIDCADLTDKITPRSKAVLVVHMCGAAADMDGVMEIARTHDLRVIEDMAQSNGATFQGRPVGSFGDVAVVSFQYNKIVTAGEGGLLAMDEDGLFDRAFAAHDLGYPRNDQGRLVFDDPNCQLWGQGSRMGELGAAMSVAQERKLDDICADMRRAAHRLYAGLSRLPGAEVRQTHDPDGECGAFVLVTWESAEQCRAMVEGTVRRGVWAGPKGGGNLPLNQFGVHLYHENSALVQRRPLNASGYPWSAPENAFALDYRYDRGTLPVCDDLFERTQLVGLAPGVSNGTCDRIVRAFEETCAAL